MDTQPPHQQALHRQAADLEALAGDARLRSLIPRAGVDFSSNDYLGLASSGLLEDAARSALDRGVPMGSGGSRLLRGNDPEHTALEDEAATLFGCESVLFFSSGFAANAALLSTLPQRGDLILYDALIHASAHEGMRLSRAESAAFPHNNVDALSDALSSWRTNGASGTAWIAVESLYSMDGDRAPLDDLMSLADRYGAMLLVDEAHATGVFGPYGRGLAAHLDGRSNVITLRTLGKALGCEGALLCGPTVMREFLVNRARGFIFSTAPSPLIAAVARAALQIMVEHPERRTALQARLALADRLLSPLGIASTGSPIIPIILGDNARAMSAASALQAVGYDVRGIRPPTVPTGTARLRLSITLNAGDNAIGGLAAELAKVLA